MNIRLKAFKDKEIELYKEWLDMSEVQDVYIDTDKRKDEADHLKENKKTTKMFMIICDKINIGMLKLNVYKKEVVEEQEVDSYILDYLIVEEAYKEIETERALLKDILVYLFDGYIGGNMYMKPNDLLPNLDSVLADVGFEYVEDEQMYFINHPKTKYATVYMCIGMCVGMCFGMIFGESIFGNKSTASCLGMLFGMCIGQLIGQAIDKKNNVEVEEEEKEDIINKEDEK